MEELSVPNVNKNVVSLNAVHINISISVFILSFNWTTWNKMWLKGRKSFALDRTTTVTCKYNALVIHKFIHLHARGGLVCNYGMIKLLMRIVIRVRCIAILGRYIVVYTDLHKTERNPTKSKNINTDIKIY